MKHEIKRTIHSNIMLASVPSNLELVQPNYDVSDSSFPFLRGDSPFTDTWPVSCYLFEGRRLPILDLLPSHQATSVHGQLSATSKTGAFYTFRIMSQHDQSLSSRHTHIQPCQNRDIELTTDLEPA